jgi:hypothetical protein
MCHWYAHSYTCKHVTYALGKYCNPASLVQTPCKKKSIWQTIRMGEYCENCAIPVYRGVNGGGDGGEGEGNGKDGKDGKTDKNDRNERNEKVDRTSRGKSVVKLRRGRKRS